MTKEELKLISTDQEYWDACVIKTWRNFGSTLDAMNMFHTITGKKINEIDPPLLRSPMNTWWKMGIRIFVNQRLSKIHNWLINKPPEKDVLLLKKLKNSKYDTEHDVIRDNNLSTEMARVYTNRKRVGMSTLNYSNRNQKTDWRVTK